MSAESQMYESVAVQLGEVVRQFREKYPKRLAEVLDDIDMSDDALNELLEILGMGEEDEDEDEA